MLYDAYEVQRSFLAGASKWAGLGAGWLTNPANPLAYVTTSPLIAAGLEVFASAAAPHGKPEFGIRSVQVEGKEIAVHEEVVLRKPFGQLKRFVREGVATGPRLLIVAPMSGHYATLLRGTVERMLPGHDVYITDWRDAKLVPQSEGGFDLDDYVDYLIEFLEKIGETTGERPHMIAVCQPAVPAWYPGAGRRVYPGFLQLAGFMSMNLGNHMMSHWEMFKHLVDGDGESADKTKEFYDEYRAVCDMTAEFYLQTIEQVFQEHALPKGEFAHRGKAIDPAKSTDTALLPIDGERDDISGVGQTRAALDLAAKLPKAKKQYLLAKGVGHYGIFNGRKWREQIAPAVEKFIAANA
jgi:poly(3-hydroxybutyrate) depolymerase